MNKGIDLLWRLCFSLSNQYANRYRRYAGAKRRLQNEQFIELFDVDLVRLPREVCYFADVIQLVHNY